MIKIFISIISLVLCCETYGHSLSAQVMHLENGDFKVKITNKGDSMLMSNPVKTGYVIKFEPKIEGYSGSTIQIKKPEIFAKHLILLHSGRSFRFDSDSYEFIICHKDLPESHNSSNEKVRIQSIRIFMSTYDDFRENGVSAMKRNSIPCETVSEID